MPASYEVVIVGGGLAGLTAAYALAREGVAVLVVERGEYPGAKNLFGGALHIGLWRSHFPELWEAMPLERQVRRHVFTMTSGSSQTSLQWETEQDEPGGGSYTVLRPRFDRWLGGEARRAGAQVLPSALVQEVVYDKGRLKGVRVDRAQGVIPARAVVLAEGVNGGLASRLGLGSAFGPGTLSLGIKQVLALPEPVVDERFNGRGGRGSAHWFFGSCLEGRAGGGFLYTNRDTLSLGVVLPLEELSRSPRTAPEIMLRYKESSPVQDLIAGARPREYGAHLIPQGAAVAPRSLVGEGVLVVGDAAGLVLNTGFKIRGGDLAGASGLAAARALLAARKNNDYSRRGLAGYLRHLQELQVAGLLDRLAQVPKLLKNPRLYQQYPQLVCQVMQRLCGVNLAQEPRLWSILNQGMKRGGPGWLRTMRDLTGWVRRL